VSSVKQLARIGIPLAMCTQHPDSASRCIDANEEVQEAVKDIMDFDSGGFCCDEKMVDYEGKLTPYHQVKWIAEELSRLGFKAGRDFILTPRLPNPRLENLDRHLIVLISSLVTNLEVPDAVKYVINPMTGSVDELLKLQKRLWNIQKLLEDEAGRKLGFEVSVIPLIEDVEVMLNIDNLIKRWLIETVMFTERGEARIMIGKSDPAMIYGHAPSIISIKIALSRLWKISKELDIKIYPIIGVGRLPFRGHLSPEAVNEFADTYRWFYTVTIQSGIRFDMGPTAVREVLMNLQDKIGRAPRIYSENEEEILKKACKILVAEYLRIVIRLADKILIINSFIPKRRDRMDVTKYSRSIQESALFSEDRELIEIVEDRNIILPRAINFVAALYTMGIAPTLLGLGRGLRRVEKELGGEALELVIKELSPIIYKDLEFDLALLEPSLARKYMDSRAFKLYMDDIEEIRNMFNIEPLREEWVEKHRELIMLFYKNFGKAESVKYLIEAGIVRGSLG